MADAGRKPEVILVADDIPANVELLLDQLNSLGYDTITATDGPSAIAAASEHQPDLCILDVSMPAGDLGVDDRSTGFEVCRRIKRDPRTARIPVIFVTALNDTTDRVKAIEAGGDDFLTKPHNRLVLGARVRSLLKLKAATDALEDSLRENARSAGESCCKVSCEVMICPFCACATRRAARFTVSPNTSLPRWMTGPE